MHATIAMPMSGRLRSSQWLDCRQRIRQVWLKWRGHLPDGSRRLEEDCGLPSSVPSSDWVRQAHDLLKSIGLHIVGVPGKVVFRHRPAPNMNQRDARRKILDEHGLFPGCGGRLCSWSRTGKVQRPAPRVPSMQNAHGHGALHMRA